jgi:hypothetical protein
MGKPLEHTYNNEDMRVATFRISHGQWENFQKKCKAQNKSASEAITAFIDSVIGGDSIPETKGDFPDIEAMVREQVKAAIANIQPPTVETAPALDIRGEVIAAISSLSPEDFDNLKKSDLEAVAV